LKVLRKKWVIVDNFKVYSESHRSFMAAEKDSYLQLKIRLLPDLIVSMADLQRH
jgi:hypothetical protein